MNIERNKGITLIALIVTIVVLLILAGVTISQITGSENAMEKATEAREKNEQGAELDAIKLAVVNSITKGLNGLVDADTLKSELNGLIDETSRNAITNEKTSWIVTANSGLKYKIKQNGEVTSAEPVDTVEFAETTTTIKIGKSKTLALSIKGKSGNETEANNIEYSFSVEDIAEVLDNGQIKILDTVSPDTKVIVTAIADGVSSSNSCEITAEEDILEIGTAINADKYGYKVNGYNVKISEVGCWRLFYQDENNTYIIANIPQGTYKPSDYYAATGENRYKSGANISNVGKGLNPMYYTTYPNKFTTTYNGKNIRALAWMTDTTNILWSQYKDAEGKAEWAIASPSLELIIASYNAVKEYIDTKIIAGTTIEESRTSISTSINEKGYSVGQKGLKENYNHGIYNYAENDVGFHYWIASPHKEDNLDRCAFVRCSRYFEDINATTVDSSERYVRPLVCIPTNIFNETYTLLDE